MNIEFYQDNAGHFYMRPLWKNVLIDMTPYNSRNVGDALTDARTYESAWDEFNCPEHTYPCLESTIAQMDHVATFKGASDSLIYVDRNWWDTSAPQLLKEYFGWTSCECGQITGEPCHTLAPIEDIQIHSWSPATFTIFDGENSAEFEAPPIVYLELSKFCVSKVRTHLRDGDRERVNN